MIQTNGRQWTSHMSHEIFKVGIFTQLSKLSERELEKWKVKISKNAFSMTLRGLNYNTFCNSCIFWPPGDLPILKRVFAAVIVLESKNFFLKKGQKSGFPPFLKLLLGQEMHFLSTRGKSTNFVIRNIFLKFFRSIWWIYPY